jgi:uncharacterized protein (TIGR03437 family)
MSQIRLLSLAAWLLCFVASGQVPFYNLTTNGDGRVLYVTTTLRQKGTDFLAFPRIFRLDENGLELWADRPEGLPTLTPIYRLSRPLLKANGEVLALENVSSCSGRACNSVQLHRTDFPNPDGSTREINSRFLLSRNRRYGAAMRKIDRFFEVPAEVWDLQTWTKVWEHPPDPEYPGSGIKVADDGSLLEFQTPVGETRSSRLMRYGSDVREIVRFGESVVSWDTDASGASVVAVLQPFDAGPEATARLVRVDVATGDVRELGSLVAGSRIIPELVSILEPLNDVALSADGNVAVVSEGVDGDIQLFAKNPRETGSPRRQLTSVPGGVLSFTLSDDGGVVWAVTNQAQILKVDVASGTSTEFVGRSFLVPSTNDWAQGGRFTITGFGLTETRGVSPGAPWPDSLAGVKVFINGTPARLEFVHPNQISGQVSWSTPSDRVDLRVEPAPSNPFEKAELAEPTRQRVIEAAPNFLTDSPPCCRIIAAHGDWRGRMTPSDPARGGEVLHLYATGLGAVANTPGDGEATPTDRSRLLSPIRCETSPTVFHSAVPIEVLWAGLAPGMVAVYQISIRLPERVPSFSESVEITCTIGEFRRMTGDLIIDRRDLFP